MRARCCPASIDALMRLRDGDMMVTCPAFLLEYVVDNTSDPTSGISIKPDQFGKRCEHSAL
jgi:hypothetical protein